MADRMFMFDLALAVPMVGATTMLLVVVGAQRTLRIQPDYQL